MTSRPSLTRECRPSTSRASERTRSTSCDRGTRLIVPTTKPSARGSCEPTPERTPLLPHGLAVPMNGYGAKPGAVGGSSEERPTRARNAVASRYISVAGSRANPVRLLPPDGRSLAVRACNSSHAAPGSLQDSEFLAYWPRGQPRAPVGRDLGRPQADWRHERSSDEFRAKISKSGEMSTSPTAGM